MNAREAAFHALTAVTRDGAYTSLALKNHIPSALSTEDRRFASLLVRTTLENLITIDFALAGFITSARVHGSVRNILRLGACQMLFMDTKSYAAVSESVAIAKKTKPQTMSFVNAVLRAFERGRNNIVYPQEDTAHALSVNFSYPLWICEKYIADFGFDFAKALLGAGAPHNTHVRLNSLKTDAVQFENALAKQGLAFSRSAVTDGYAVNGLTDLENTDLYQSGWMAVQSQSAMQAVLGIGLSGGEAMLDCCAAPGGKSAYAAALANGRIDLMAWDVHEHRVDMMRRNFERLGIRAHVQKKDAAVPDGSLAESFDVVLVDAPCSAMGLMAHSPDVRYARKQKDIAQLAALQSKLLSVCSAYVKKGGKLVYMTCSINKEENENVADDFLRKQPRFKHMMPPVTLYPHQCGSDGFFYAVMRKT